VRRRSLRRHLAAAVWPLFVAHSRKRAADWLSAFSAEISGPCLEAFRQDLAETGYVETRN
jgi:hypothetical protein